MDIAWRPAMPPHAPAPPLERPYAEPPLSPEDPSLSGGALARARTPAHVSPFAPRVGPDLKTPAIMGYAFYPTAIVVPVLPLAAVVLAYLKRGEARGTLYESHFRWQIGTFWRGAAMAAASAAAGGLAWLAFDSQLVGANTALVGMAITGLQVLHRVAQGWYQLKQGHPPEGAPRPSPAAATPTAGNV